MKCLENAFNKDVCLFEVSRSISIPPSNKINLPNSKRLIFDRESLEKISPILATELSRYLDKENIFYLDLMKNEEEVPAPYMINGKALVFIFSGSDSNYKPGSIISLFDGESLSLSMKSFRNHFIGIAVKNDSFSV